MAIDLSNNINLVTTPSEVVNFDKNTPTTSGVVFTPNTPLTQNVLYVSSTNASTWIYDGETYITYTATPTATTPFYIQDTTIDAGGNKTAPIQHNGYIKAYGFYGSGAGINFLNANYLAAGTVPTARLGSGTADSTTYLRGDGSWSTISAGGLVAKVTAGIPTYYSTIEAAVTAATSGDLIVVYPGSYTISTTATNGIAKSGVDFYFHSGASVTKTTSGSIFYDTGFANTCNVYGFGTFTKTTSAGYIYYNTKSNAVFEAKSVTSSISHCFVTDIGNVRFKVDYATSTAGAVLSMNQSNTSVDNNIRIDMIHWKSTASSAITGGWWYYTNLYVTGNRLESTTAYAVSMYNTSNRINLNVDLILGVNYGSYTYDGFTSIVNINCTYITGIQDCNTVSLNGFCGKLNFNGTSFSGGMCGDITVASGIVNTVASSNLYAGTQTTPIVVTGGVLNMYQHKTAYGIIFNITGGIFNLYGTVQSSQISTTSGRIVNGGEMNLYGRFNHGGNMDSASYYGIWLQSGTLRLHSPIKVGFNDSNGHGILWTGGKLIIEDSSIITTSTLTYPIKALSAGLQLRVNGRLSHNRTEQGSILAGKKHKYKYQTNAIASTSLYCNDGTGGDELFQVTDLVTYSTQALIAARMVTLINASGTLDMTASQDNPGIDTYFYLEMDTAGYNFASMGNNNSSTNLTITLMRIGSYAMTEICGGTIIENANIE